MDTLDGAIAALDTPAALLPSLRALGRRHVRYGVRAEHYAPVGAALLETLRAALGSQWTPAAAAAWTAVRLLLGRPVSCGMQCKCLGPVSTPILLLALCVSRCAQLYGVVSETMLAGASDSAGATLGSAQSDAAAQSSPPPA